MMMNRRGSNSLMKASSSRRLAGLGQDMYEMYGTSVPTIYTMDYVPPDYSYTPLPSYTPGGSSWSMPSLQEIIDAAKSVGGAYMTFQQAQKVQDINLQRARAGLPLLTASQMATLSPQMNFGLTSQTQTLLMVGGGLLLITMLMRGGRRAA